MRTNPGPRLLERLTSDRLSAIHGALHLRTSGECKLVELILRDAPEAEMATGLGLSVNTVHSYLRLLYEKLGVASRLQVAVLVFVTHLELPPEGTPTARPTGARPLTPTGGRR
jgi:DNA-binding CsgD family transcriptional regulator